SGDGGSLDIETGSLSLTNSLVGAGTDGTGNAGSVQIKAANSITLEDSGLVVSTESSGDGGSLTIDTGSLNLTNSLVGATTIGTGNAGDIQIKAANSITLEDESFLSVATLGEEIGSGDAGSLAIETGSLSLTNSSAIGASTLGSGSAGKITITASEYIKIVGADTGIFSASGSENFPNATGNAGTITIGKNPSVPAPTLTLTEGGEISTASWGAGVSGEIDINIKNLEINQGGKIDSSSQGSGSAGKITITASEYLKIFGEGSGIFSTSRATGNAGTITIGGETLPVPTLTVTENGQISTSTFGAGEGGEIDININNLEITQGGKIDSSSSGTGSAGKIAITASQYLQIVGNNSGIFSTTSNTGNAGQINILAGGTPFDGVEIIPGSLFSASAELLPHDQGGIAIENGGKISTSTTGQGDGGTITITSSKLRLNNASITADNEVADFNQAGNIIIGAHQLDMSDSRISTSSTNADGGNILIGVRELNNKRITDSEIAATAGETGIGGNLEISGPNYLILDSTNLRADADKGGNLTVDA
ncbi:filamentous hemagglutinin family, partial [Candidatus Thiomargarita nelsonii]